ncbi:hypothetical protein [Streptomyces zagrosensis]|uniref:Uncharacterized protein n=1 Tax=Streptomyces zagrosensis TaxID=1042984 RepID=A0A7W9V3G5_9ACTN|nr:hypothetical protein [Streptomyces zagrosensis]MBB5939869.1 hypothetical protein [Streptomyces zagrosensis]
MTTHSPFSTAAARQCGTRAAHGCGKGYLAFLAVEQVAAALADNDHKVAALTNGAAASAPTDSGQATAALANGDREAK